MTHREYFKKYGLSVEQYGEILAAQAFCGKKSRELQKGFDFEARIKGKPARIEVKSKLAQTRTGQAYVVHCNNNKFAPGAMTHLALVLVNPDSGLITGAWLIAASQAKKLRRTRTKSKYIRVEDIRRALRKQDITNKLNKVASSKV